MRNLPLFRLVMPTACALCFLLPVSAVAERVTSVLIFPIRGVGVELSEGLNSEIREYLGARLTLEGVYKVMPESQVHKDLGLAKARSYQDCYDEACRIDLTKAVAADKSLSVTIAEEDGICRVTAVIYDIAQEVAEVAADKKVGCSFLELKDSMIDVAAELTARTKKAPRHKADPVVPPPKAVAPTPPRVVEAAPEVNAGKRDVGVFTVPAAVGKPAGHLYVASKPEGAAVFLDGRDTGKTTPVLFEELPVGKYSVRLENAMSVQERAVEVVGDQIKRVMVPMNVNKVGSLMIETVPPEVAIILDGNVMGQSPQLLTSVLVGQHTVAVGDGWAIKQVNEGAGRKGDVAGGGTSTLKPRVGVVSLPVFADSRSRFQLVLRKWTPPLVEWFGVNVGGGYLVNSSSYGMLNVTLFTMNFGHFYYGLLEGGINPAYSRLGIGQRLGYQFILRHHDVIRIGLKLGWELWFDDSLVGYEEEVDMNGLEVTPHFQYVRYFAHGSVGFGIDVPLAFPLEIYDSYNDDYDSPGDFHDDYFIAAGIQFYFMFTLF